MKCLANKLVKHISILSKKDVKKTKNPFEKDVIGGFGSLFDLSNIKIKDPVIVSCTDGVGTKIDLANKFKKFDTIGIDLVAMCVNDLIVQGAKPLFFLDYIAVGKLNLNKTKKILIKIDPYYFRPMEVNELRGDARKARRELKWKPEISFKKLVHEMVQKDIEKL